jgi:hypothetical protein
MSKKLMSFVVMVEQGVKVNWLVVVFNNLYHKLQDLSTLIKPNVSRDNTLLKFLFFQINQVD